MKKIIFLIAVFLAVQVLFMSKGVTYGENASGLESRISYLKEENRNIELEIATLVSCSNIAQKAEEKGFIPVSLAESAGNHVPVALKR